jgi:hypothetical protein
VSRARWVVESATGICASKWRILDKVIETKVIKCGDIVKCISVLHNIIIDLRIIVVCIPDYLSMTSYRCRPHERPGRSGQTSLVASTSQSVRFARSLATRWDAGQPHLHTCTRVCPLKWVSGKRASTVAAGTQDIALHCAIGQSQQLSSRNLTLQELPIRTDTGLGASVL